jgi:hypothetical protein
LHDSDLGPAHVYMLIWHCHTIMSSETVSREGKFSLHLFVARGRDQFETKYLLLSMGLVEQTQCIGNTRIGQYFVFVVVEMTVIPRDSAGTFAVACKLCRGGNKFHLPFQNRAAFS